MHRERKREREKCKTHASQARLVQNVPNIFQLFLDDPEVHAKAEEVYSPTGGTCAQTIPRQPPDTAFTESSGWKKNSWQLHVVVQIRVVITDHQKRKIWICFGVKNDMRDYCRSFQRDEKIKTPCMTKKRLFTGRFMMRSLKTMHAGSGGAVFSASQQEGVSAWVISGYSAFLPQTWKWGYCPGWTPPLVQSQLGSASGSLQRISGDDWCMLGLGPSQKWTCENLQFPWYESTHHKL